MTSGHALFQAALRLAPPPAALVERCSAADWQQVAALAAYHQVEGLVWAALKPFNPPAAQAEVWQAAYYRNALINTARSTEVQAICADMATWGVAPLLLKGMALLSSIYAHPGLRMMSDVDLLVRRRDVPVAWAVLSSHGYLLQPASPRYWALQHRNSGELKLAHHQSTALIELHWWLFAGSWAEHAGLLERPDPWLRVRTLQLGAQPVLQLHPHDELLHLCHHLAVSNQFGSGVGRMLVDVDRVVRARPLGWSQLIAEARQLGLATVLWLTLSLSRSYLGTPVPDLSALQPPWWQRRLLQRLVSFNDVMGGSDLRRVPGQRQLVLLLLMDRPDAAMRLVAQGVREPIRWPMTRRRAQTQR